MRPGRIRAGNGIGAHVSIVGRIPGGAGVRRRHR
jgi:hypothetical protein